ncbi:TonB dependent receptor [Taibaiella koreensis]|uniref:TonB dependent receptor n=1 Tax=Taibaiella koreensis TaxID=1268548 RepID=UPI000E59A3C3|nr:TonB dependent receptor [Taibaiella koreensis]
MKLTLLLSCLFSLCGSVSFAQSTCSLSGKLKDTKGEPLPGASLMLFRDTVLLRTAISDAGGGFILEALPQGTYTVKASSVGFEPYTSTPVMLQANLILPDILLKEQGGQLREVTIQAQKPFIEVRADKIVVNVENSIVSAGSSVMDVLQRSPGVNVDNNDNISLKGKVGVVIWIDGKPSPMQGADLATVLRAMPAGSVDKIEIIANPGARFDAAGSGGIINIKTKKDKRLGLNGTATLSYGQGQYPKYGAGINLNYRNKKLNVYANYNYAYRYWFNHLMLDRKFLDTTGDSRQLFRYNQDNYSLYNFSNHIASAGVDYSIGPQTTVGAALSFSSNSFDPKADNVSQALDGSNRLLYNFNTTGRHTNFYYNYAANINLRHSFDSSGRELSIDADYAAFENQSNQYFVTTYRNPDGSVYQPDYYLKSDLEGVTRIQSLKADYVHPLDHGLRLEAGLKASFAQADNEPLFYEMVNGDYTLDTKRSNHFIYQENINAGYVNASKDWSKWSMQLGLRVENTNAQWEQRTTSQQYDTSYTQLFPSLALQYHLHAKHDLGITFSRRIERPNYQQLNPFKYFIDKTTYREGYPYLQPASFYSVELSHTFNQRFVTTFTFGINKGVITEVIQPSETEDSVTVQTNKNLRQMTFVGLSGAYPFQLTRWWSNVTNFNIYYALYEGNIANTPLRNGSPTFDLNTNNTFLLPGDFSAELGFFYQARQIYGYMDVQPLWMLNAGIQKHLLRKRATIKLNIQDIFFTGYPRATSVYTGYREDFVAERETRVANIAFIYRFGKNTVSPVRKRGGGAEEEKNRAASGNS